MARAVGDLWRMMGDTSTQKLPSPLIKTRLIYVAISRGALYARSLGSTGKSGQASQSFPLKASWSYQSGSRPVPHRSHVGPRQFHFQ